ncbi:hypothetical protein DERF_015832 [Dermatophagoides farinae]|uniref:Uncharacterized protein n=1 Tax=Dermatophagoides farinae TaxID=6954 RepID=A0A922L0P7_DERFA|nr:hypothetical protein DERF_015832 [Dermatophagoides farinae]
MAFVVHVPLAFTAGMILSPICTCLTLEPIRTTSATPSLPAIAGKLEGFTGYTPCIEFISAGLIGEAKYLTII